MKRLFCTKSLFIVLIYIYIIDYFISNRTTTGKWSLMPPW